MSTWSTQSSNMFHLATKRANSPLSSGLSLSCMSNEKGWPSSARVAANPTTTAVTIVSASFLTAV